MITLLTYLSLITGGLLVLLLIMGIIGGMDLDMDIDADTEGEASPGMGGVGIVKATLTFLSIGSWTMRIMLITSSNPLLSLLAGVAAGAVAVYLLSLVVSWLLGQEADVNWQAEDALRQKGTVYLRIPAGGEGIVRVEVKGGLRELKARSTQKAVIPTGTLITVEECTDDGVVLVRPVGHVANTPNLI
ncbi:hypothetical protein [Lewinella sp. IMCC34191]|uniref:hypothetical protein n=1 Tax=Lewinella sp. IMCC34191 TaxID=2259172 RepID=UPI000E26FB78|nr:hypothetical protein [Lewinella sp. IMCC34191]